MGHFVSIRENEQRDLIAQTNYKLSNVNETHQNSFETVSLGNVKTNSHLHHLLNRIMAAKVAIVCFRIQSIQSKVQLGLSIAVIIISESVGV